MGLPRRITTHRQNKKYEKQFLRTEENLKRKGKTNKKKKK
jgi:hypothetical protein